MNELKYFKTSLLSSLVAMVPAMMFFLFVALTSTNGEIDDAPMRAGWGLLFLSPVIFLILIMFFYTITRFLSWLGKLKIQYLEMFVFVVSVLFAYCIASDSLSMFLICFLMFSAWLSIGAVSWNYFGILRYNKRLQVDGSPAALRD